MINWKKNRKGECTQLHAYTKRFINYLMEIKIHKNVNCISIRSDFRIHNETAVRIANWEEKPNWGKTILPLVHYISSYSSKTSDAFDTIAYNKIFQTGERLLVSFLIKFVDEIFFLFFFTFIPFYESYMLRCVIVKIF